MIRRKTGDFAIFARNAAGRPTAFTSPQLTRRNNNANAVTSSAMSSSDDEDENHNITGIIYLTNDLTALPILV
jgi:hypothetical protein